MTLEEMFDAGAQIWIFDASRDRWRPWKSSRPLEALRSIQRTIDRMDVRAYSECCVVLDSKA